MDEVNVKKETTKRKDLSGKLSTDFFIWCSSGPVSWPVVYLARTTAALKPFRDPCTPTNELHACSHRCPSAHGPEKKPAATKSPVTIKDSNGRRKVAKDTRQPKKSRKSPKQPVMTSQSRFSPLASKITTSRPLALPTPVLRRRPVPLFASAACTLIFSSATHSSVSAVSDDARVQYEQGTAIRTRRVAPEANDFLCLRSAKSSCKKGVSGWVKSQYFVTKRCHGFFPSLWGGATGASAEIHL
ncbi:hypothetical protein K438DRAFT_2116150 [Mycena galopus ATCC 62051]|nr:hypothetical protein K438DRAFT_2116150 [Mycena galopus ATCC 62051]